MAGQLKEELVLKTGQFSQGINSAISEVEKLKKKGNELGSGFDKSLGGIISKLKGFNAAALVGLAAGKALGEYFKRNAEINNTLMSSYKMLNSGMETFWNTMASGNWSNFLSNLKNATNAAKEAYYALDQLESSKTFNEVRLKRLEVAYNKFRNLAKDRNLTEKQRLVYLNNAKRIMNQQLSIMQYQLKVQIRLAKLKYDQALSEVGLNSNQISQHAFEKLTGMSQEQIDKFKKNFEKLERQARSSGKYNKNVYDNGNDTVEFDREKWLKENRRIKAHSIIYDLLNQMDALKGNEAFSGYIEAEKDALQLENEINNAKAELSSDEYKLDKEITKEYEKQEKIVERIKQQWQNAYNKSLKFSEDLMKETKDINVNDNTRISSMSVYDKLRSQQYQDLVNQGKGKFSTENNGGIKTHDKQGFEVYFKMNDESVEDIYTKYNRLVQRVQEAMKDSDIGILSADEVNATIEKINEEIEKLGLKPLELHVKTDAEKALSKVSQEIGQVASAFGQLGQAFEEPALNVAAVMAQAIATIIEGYAKATAEAANYSPWVWLGFSLTALGELASIISSVKSMGQYANGGVVGGSSYSGDKLYARVNSGEMILNSQQQSHLFNMINNGGTNAVNGNVKFVIKGTDLQGVLNNYNHKMGKVR